MTLRRLRHSIAGLPEKIQLATEAAWILALSYFIAYLETLAISNVRGNVVSCLLPIKTWNLSNEHAVNITEASFSFNSGVFMVCLRSELMLLKH